MKTRTKAALAMLLAGGMAALLSFRDSAPEKKVRFPYKKLGWTERQAADYLLSRFTYGATPGEADAVLKIGLENWFMQQLNAGLPDDSLTARLASYDALNLSNTEVCHTFPPGFVIRSLAIGDSAISKDSVDKAVDKKAFNAQLQAYMEKKGFRSDQDLYKQFIDQHILRAVYSNNQLREVLTDFWFNHFNVSFFKGECAQFIPAYERDVIRPNALGKFDQLLMASAKSPAMLYYLDNFSSVGAPAAAPANPAKIAQPAKPVKNVSGLNENYAREVMELHTLGVDGGYAQADVTQAARVLTGWTVYPISERAYGSAMKSLVDKIGESNLAAKGFVRDGDFLFTPNRHDPGEKTVLGHVFPATKDPAAQYQEGVTLLEMLAHHPSTAKFIARKLAVRFVADAPPQSLIDKLADSFTENDGDIRQVMITLVTAKEFWDTKNRDAKIKSPFDLAISAARALHADVKDPYPLFNWVAKMGQKIYYYQAPTGFPDRGNYWINTGALLDRMDFGLALVTGQIGGVSVDASVLGDPPANNADATTRMYSAALLPDADPDQIAKELKPGLDDPAMLAKLAQAGAPPPRPAPEKITVGAPGDMALMSAFAEPKPKPADQPVPQPVTRRSDNNLRLLIAGIMLGSPEFQKK